jgi:hypothetical protein
MFLCLAINHVLEHRQILEQANILKRARNTELCNTVRRFADRNGVFASVSAGVQLLIFPRGKLLTVTLS